MLDSCEWFDMNEGGQEITMQRRVLFGDQVTFSARSLFLQWRSTLAACCPRRVAHCQHPPLAAALSPFIANS